MTCREVTPGGTIGLAEILGKQETLSRIESGINKIGG